jgi:hypothetical protein
MNADHPVQQIADAVGGKIEEMAHLPDGSGFAVMSMPLPKDHWLTQPGWNDPPMPLRTGTADPRRDLLCAHIVAAGRYAVRSATANGTIEDFDPDAMVQNFVIGMLGYFTPSGLSGDSDLTVAGEVPG